MGYSDKEATADFGKLGIGNVRRHIAAVNGYKTPQWIISFHLLSGNIIGGEVHMLADTAEQLIYNTETGYHKK